MPQFNCSIFCDYASVHPVRASSRKTCINAIFLQKCRIIQPMKAPVSKSSSVPFMLMSNNLFSGNSPISTPP